MVRAASPLSSQASPRIFMWIQTILPGLCGKQSAGGHCPRHLPDSGTFAQGSNLGKNAILIGTVGKSWIIDRLIHGHNIDAAPIAGCSFHGPACVLSPNAVRAQRQTAPALSEST